MTTPFVSTTEFRDQAIGIDLSRYTDTTLSGVLTRATAKAELFVGYTLPYEAVVNEKTEGQIDPNRDIMVFPKKIPARSLTSMTICKGTFSATVNLTDSNGNNRYDIPNRGDIIYVNGDVVTFDAISIVELEALRYSSFFTEISYTAGYYMYDRPQDLIDAICLIAQDEIARSQNTSGASEIRQGAVTIKYSSQTTRDTHKSDKVLDAEAILTLYKRQTGW